MEDISDKYLVAFDVEGFLPLVNAVLQDEIEDYFVAKTSKIISQPDLAYRCISMAILDTKASVMRSLLTGSIFRDHLVLKSSAFSGLVWSPASTSLSRNITQVIDGSWSIQGILETETVDSEINYQIFRSTEEVIVEPDSCLVG
ncbi:hypothetical protein ACEPPN_019072 [Leptodophora sp. 'Broadleaf-Isolate-01']